jgi:hypothetical protein
MRLIGDPARHYPAKARFEMKKPQRNLSEALMADDFAVAFNDQFRGITLIKHAEAGF